jgi:hypothetical protein
LKFHPGVAKLESMQWLRLMVLGWALAFAAEEPPRCGQSLRGTLWPVEANSKQEARRQALKCGELRMCTRGLWRFRWEAVGVPYWRLAGEKAPESCAAAVAQVDTKEAVGPGAVTQ